MRAAAALAARIRGSQHVRAKSHRTGAQLSHRVWRYPFSHVHDFSLSGLKTEGLAERFTRGRQLLRERYK
jgi:hypothetical protein